MEKLGICGYRCDLCSLFKDNYSESMLETIRKGFVKYFNHHDELSKCEGCPEDGNPECKIKPCAVKKEVINCACCKKYKCETMMPAIKVITDKLQKSNDISKEDFDMFFKPYLCEENFKHIRRPCGHLESELD